MWLVKWICLSAGRRRENFGRFGVFGIGQTAAGRFYLQLQSLVREGQGRDKEPDRNLTPYGQGTGHYGQGTGHYGHPTDTRGHEGTCPRALLGPHL